MPRIQIQSTYIPSEMERNPNQLSIISKTPLFLYSGRAMWEYGVTRNTRIGLYELRSSNKEQTKNFLKDNR